MKKNYTIQQVNQDSEFRLDLPTIIGAFLALFIIYIIAASFLLIN